MGKPKVNKSHYAETMFYNKNFSYPAQRSWVNPPTLNKIGLFPEELGVN